LWFVPANMPVNRLKLPERKRGGFYLLANEFSELLMNERAAFELILVQDGL